MALTLPTAVSSAKFNPDKHMTTWYYTCTDSQSEQAEGLGYAERRRHSHKSDFYKSLTKKWNQYTRVGHGSLLTDLSRPDPPQIIKSQTRPVLYLS